MLLALAVATVIIASMLVYQHRRLMAATRASRNPGMPLSIVGTHPASARRSVSATLYMPTADAPRDWTKPEAYRELA